MASELIGAGVQDSEQRAGGRTAPEAAVGETATKAAFGQGGRQPNAAGHPVTARMERLLRNADFIAYWLVVAPLAARLPARFAYRVACWRGDAGFRYRTEKRSEIVRNLRQVFGDEIGPEEAQRQAREFFRAISCEVIDAMLLRDRAQRLGKLVEIRGREHLDAALAEGRGAILCSAHFGSYNSAFSLLHESGFPLTTIGRSVPTAMSYLSPIQQRLWNFVYIRRMRRHRQRPGIELQLGGIQAAVQAAVALRANEVVTISSDAPPLEADLSRAADVTFLGRPARLLPGVVTLARLTGAPIFMMLMHRSADYRHQVLEISPQVSADDDPATTFGHCVAVMETAIRAKPADWVYWANTADLVRLGLLPAAPRAGEAVVPQPATGDSAAPLEDRRSASGHRGEQLSGPDGPEYSAGDQEA